MDTEDVTYRWIDIYIHTQWNTPQSLKKNKLLPFAATWMDPEGIMASEKVRQRQTLYTITYMWNQKNLSLCPPFPFGNHSLSVFFLIFLSDLFTYFC